MPESLMTESLHWIDWLIVIGFTLLTMVVGFYFTRRASKNIQSFFVSARSLPWHLVGISMIASAFASDTPLWVTSLIRRYGIYYIWQYWAPMIGASLAVVLFARLWRRMAVMTDIEFLECRYSGKTAGTLRFLQGTLRALLICPLVISWVTRAMEVITREAMALPDQYRVLTTFSIVAFALVMCVFSGLWGVVYTAFLQFIVATAGTIVLAWFAVARVGGLTAMVDKLSSMQDWPGHTLNILPSVGPGPMQMSIWNAVGYFGFFWMMVAVSGGYMAQRMLACKDSRHATLAMLLNSVLYYGVICWPWIIVGACSLIIFPNLGEGVSHDNAYPRMIVYLLPIGLRGMLVAAMLAAFVSTISTLFNWSSSYLINDVYKRFIYRDGSTKHYVLAARVGTILIGVLGGTISLFAANIQQLLMINYVVNMGLMTCDLLRWFWWRLNAKGNLAAVIVAYLLAPTIIFAKVFDAPARVLLNLPPEANFSSDLNLLGARMIFTIIIVTSTAVIVSLLTRPTADERLRDFIMRAKPFRFFWKSVIKRLNIEYQEHESFTRTIVSWILAVASVGSVIFGIGKLLLGQPKMGLFWIGLFCLCLWLTVRRINEDFADDLSAPPAQQPVGDSAEE
jgi:Na+/proline symporter